MPKNFTMKPEISEIIKYECDFRYTRAKMAVTASGSDVEIKCGTPYVRSTATPLTETKSATPAAWTAVLDGEFGVGTPEVYTIKLGGTWAADDTLKITLDGVDWKTFTAKANPTIASMQFNANGTGETIVENILEYIGTSNQPTNWKVTGEGDTLILTYKDASDGKYVTITKSSTAGTAVLLNTQNNTAGTFTVGSTTVTVVDGTPSTNQVKAGPAADVAKSIVALGLTVSGYTVANGKAGEIVFTQSSASDTETPPTFTAANANGRITTTQTASYAAAVDGNTSSIDCIALENKIIPEGETYDVLVLVGGLSIVDIDKILGVTDKAAMAAQLATLGIKTMSEDNIFFQRT